MKLKSFVLVNETDIANPVILWRCQARDKKHAEEKLPILYGKPLGPNDHLMDYYTFRYEYKQAQDIWNDFSRI